MKKIVFALIGGIVSAALFAAPPSDPDAFARYHDNTHRFAFSYPRTWTPVSTESSSDQLKVVSESGKGREDCSVNVRYVAALRDWSPDAYVQSVAKADFLQRHLRVRLPDAHVVHSRVTHLSNQDAFYAVVEATYESMGLEVPVKMIQAFTARQGNVYVITCRAHSASFPLMEREFQVMMAGFEIQNAAGADSFD